jgi:hypothetical protein
MLLSQLRELEALAKWIPACIRGSLLLALCSLPVSYVEAECTCPAISGVVKIGKNGLKYIKTANKVSSLRQLHHSFPLTCLDCPYQASQPRPSQLASWQDWPTGAQSSASSLVSGTALDTQALGKPAPPSRAAGPATSQETYQLPFYLLISYFGYS